MPSPTTIKRIRAVKNAGLFREFTTAAEVPDFCQVNAFYGFNGAGKTTLSRIFGSLDTESIRRQLPDTTEFSVELSDGSVLRNGETKGTLAGRLLVFDVDFVDENLLWKEGTAKPIFYLGEAQAKLSEEIKQLEAKVGKLHVKTADATKDLADNERALATHKRDSARHIADRLGLGRGYLAPALAKDQENFIPDPSQTLTEQKETELHAIVLQDRPLPKMALLCQTEVELSGLAGDTKATLATSLTDLAIDSLQEHSTMVNWVSQGADYHEEHQLTTCLFCGGELSAARLERLQHSLDHKFENLRLTIADQQRRANELRTQLGSLQESLPSQHDISQDLRIEFQLAASTLIARIAKVKEALAVVEKALEEKAADPMRTLASESLIEASQASEWDKQVRECVTAINQAIAEHNKVHDEFGAEQERARGSLKQHCLAEDHAEYVALCKRVADSERTTEDLNKELADSSTVLAKLKQDIRRHGPAAERINTMIRSYLGHNELQIVAVDDGYQLWRQGRAADGPVSEGEKSAIALCYFLTMIEAEGRKLKDLVVVIDDPISSLDTQALNYAFNLVKSLLAGSAQLILLTHNLQFLGEIRKWLNSRVRPRNGGPPTAMLFFLDTKQDASTGVRSSRVTELPTLLRVYESEYHYLFYQALRFREDPSNSEYLYLMPNAMRKVLDVFLAFKIPGSGGLAEKIAQIAKKMPGIDQARVLALDRLVQAESHAENLDSLVALSPLTVEETATAAEALFSLIETMDSDHYQSMCSLCHPRERGGDARGASA